MEPLYLGHLGNLVKSAVLRGVLISGVGLYDKSILGAQQSVLSTEAFLFQRSPLRGVPLYFRVLTMRFGSLLATFILLTPRYFPVAVCLSCTNEIANHLNQSCMKILFIHIHCNPLLYSVACFDKAILMCI